MKESTIQKLIRVAVNKDGRARVVRNNTGEDQLTHVRYGLGKGGADLVGALIGSARLFCIEVKRPRGPGAETDQKTWMGAVRKIGGFAAVARSPEEALAAVERACAGALE